MPIARSPQPSDADQPSRRRLLAWTTLGAASVASAALAGCSDSTPAHGSAPLPGGSGEPSDSFSPGDPGNPQAASGLPSPVAASPVAVRGKAVFTVHDLLPNAPPTRSR